MSKIVIAFLLVFVPTIVSAYEAKVVAITDGDTIKVLKNNQQIKIRLYGIDCPEKKQAFGKAAKRFLANQIAEKTVEIDHFKNDRYGRSIAFVRFNGRDINAEMIAAGYAWVYRKYCKKQPLCTQWLQAEKSARDFGHGLWQSPEPIPPWKWRKKH